MAMVGETYGFCKELGLKIRHGTVLKISIRAMACFYTASPDPAQDSINAALSSSTFYRMNIRSSLNFRTVEVLLRLLVRLRFRAAICWPAVKSATIGLKVC